jgi:hypothetical protein
MSSPGLDDPTRIIVATNMARIKRQSIPHVIVAIDSAPALSEDRALAVWRRLTIMARRR